SRSAVPEPAHSRDGCASNRCDGARHARTAGRAREYIDVHPDDGQPGQHSSRRSQEMSPDLQLAWEVMKWPLVASLLFPPLLVYLGLHVVKREVIFVDLALAQVATLGTCVALLMGHHFDDRITFWISLGVTFVGAAFFSWTRSSRKAAVPQEAIIGITFVVAAAGVILLLSRVAGGKEELEHLLTGDILNVTKGEIGQRALVFGAIAAFYAVFHRRFALISATEYAEP